MFNISKTYYYYNKPCRYLGHKNNIYRFKLESGCFVLIDFGKEYLIKTVLWVK